MNNGSYKRLRVRMPIIPQSRTDPTMMGPTVFDAERDFKQRFDRINERVQALLKSVPTERIISNARDYFFMVDELAMRSLYEQMDWIVDTELMARIGDNHWFFERYLGPAYRAGSIAAFMNIARQFDVYAEATPSIDAYTNTEPYRRRSALVRARQFELMKGIVGETKNDLARILGDGIEAGLNPRAISRQITEQIGIEEKRANRIAQTEITGALRRAKWDENEEAAQAYGIEMLELHLSALKPTTRIDHAERHGKLYTVEQVRQWYSQGANAINCYCSQTSVAVDGNGNVISPAMERRLKQMAEVRTEMVNELREKHG